jgi:DNA-binding XRE family transcriptional regulator
MYLDNMIYYVKLQADVLYLPWNSERGGLLKQFRQEAHFTREEMAEKLAPLEKASLHQIRKLEIGKGADLVKGINSTLFLEICKILNVDPSAFGYGILAQPK